MKFNGIKPYVVAAILTLSIAGVASAAAEVRYYNWHDLGWRIANFVVFAALIVYLFKKYGVGFLDAYRKGVETRIAASKANLDEAKAEMQSYRDEIESLTARLESLKAEAATEAKIKHDAVIREAHERANIIAEKYSTELQVAVDAMRKEIMGEVFEEAVKLAVDKLRGELSDEDAHSFTAKSVEAVGSLHAQSANSGGGR